MEKRSISKSTASLKNLKLDGDSGNLEPKHKKSKKKEIEIVDSGPIYICDSCHAMLKVPDGKLKEEEMEEEDEEGVYSVLAVYYICPKCNEKIIVSEEELEEEEDVKKVEKSRK